MSGHSKWANIKHKKEKTDAQRAKVFTKIGKEITIAVKEGGGDPASNSKLRDLILKAKSNNVPNDNIERTIKKALGSTGENYEEVVYEGYGPAGVAVIVEATTDNRNRTAGDIRSFFTKYNGSLGATGCVSYMFDNKGVVVVEKTESFDSDKAMELALNLDVIDCEDDEVFTIYTDANAATVNDVVSAFENEGYTILSSGVEMIPSNYAQLNEKQLEKAHAPIDSRLFPLKVSSFNANAF